MHRETIYDKLHDKERALTDKELDTIRRIRSGMFADPNVEMYQVLFVHCSGIHPRRALGCLTPCTPMSSLCIVVCFFKHVFVFFFFFVCVCVCAAAL